MANDRYTNYCHKQGIWALGIQIYFYFTGEYPIEDVNDRDQIQRFVSDQ